MSATDPVPVILFKSSLMTCAHKTLNHSGWGIMVEYDDENIRYFEKKVNGFVLFYLKNKKNALSRSGQTC